MSFVVEKRGVDIEPEIGSFLAALASAYGSDRRIRRLAVSVLPPHHTAWTRGDFANAARTLYGFVKNRFQYVPDKGENLLTIDEVADPGQWAGDCDDAVLILGSLFSSVGIPAQAVVVGNSQAPYHVVLRCRGTVYDLTGVVNPVSTLCRSYTVWGVYHIPV